MKHAWLVAVAISFLFSAPAEARKRCRTAEQPSAEAQGEAVSDAESRWPHGSGSAWVHASDAGWVHENASGSWVHGGGQAERADAGWVHETNYGWWAGLPDVALAGPDEDVIDDPKEDCTLSKDRNECVALGNQVARYRFQLGLARDREDERWESSLLQTIDGLEARAALYDCPWVGPSLREQIIVTINAVIEAAGVAAQVAAMMYRMGLL